MKRLSSSGLDDLNLGASLALGSIILFSDLIVFVTTSEDCALSWGGKFEEEVEEAFTAGSTAGAIVASSFCLSAIRTFLCLAFSAALFTLERLDVTPALEELRVVLGLLPLGAKIVGG